MSSEKGRLNIINRNEFRNFQPSPIIPYRVKTRIKSVKLKKISHDEKYAALKKKGLNIDITSSEIYVNNKKPIDGIFSPLFGADTTQDAPVFSCDCHKLTGGTNLGRVCPDCGTLVRSIEADLRLTGYIDIAPYHVLTYHGYKGFCRVMKDKGMDDIIKSVKRINVNGKIIDDGKPTIMDLYNNYEDEYEELVGIEKKYAFTSKIPVYSARLRPLMHFGMNMTILDVNKAYLSIIKSSNILKTAPLFHLDRGVEIQRTLNQIQQDFNAVFAHIEEQTNGKSGIFRRSLASGRIDFSARMVISLGIDLMPHEIDVPYSTMMVLYEGEIANYLSKLENISISKAITLVQENAIQRNEKFVKIINQLLKSKYGIWGLINRNPTISESSILYVRIRKIHDDPSDVTMHMPPDILALMGADFDGDQLTYIAIKDPAFHRLFLTMCPTYAFIDRANAKLNRAMGFKKDYAALVSAAWEIDTQYDQYLTSVDQDETAYCNLRDYGLEGFDGDMSDDVRNATIKKILRAKKDNHFRQRYYPGELEDFD